MLILLSLDHNLGRERGDFPPRLQTRRHSHRYAFAGVAEARAAPHRDDQRATALFRGPCVRWLQHELSRGVEVDACLPRGARRASVFVGPTR